MTTNDTNAINTVGIEVVQQLLLKCKIKSKHVNLFDFLSPWKVCSNGTKWLVKSCYCQVLGEGKPIIELRLTGHAVLSQRHASTAWAGEE